MSKEKYYKDFTSKREFERWIEEKIDDLDFDEGVTIEFAYENEEA